MRKWMARVAVALGAAALAFGAVTWYALEGRDVAVLRTLAADGTVRETHVWAAEDGDALLVEAATPNRPWLADIAAHPEVELERAGATTRWLAVPQSGVGWHDEVRALLRAKYGWADRWVALLQDTSSSVAVRLTR